MILFCIGSHSQSRRQIFAVPVVSAIPCDSSFLIILICFICLLLVLVRQGNQFFFCHTFLLQRFSFSFSRK